jgi:hypothetical protein
VLFYVPFVAVTKDKDHFYEGDGFSSRESGDASYEYWQRQGIKALKEEI